MMAAACRALVLAIALYPAAAAHAGKRDDTLRIPADQVLPDIDPYFNNELLGSIVGQHVWDTLVTRDAKTGEFTGQLATAWREVDATTVEFDLRRGVTFHNGQPFTADDVVYTINFIADPASGVTNQHNVNWLKSAEKIDDHKVRIHLKAPFPPYLEYLSLPVVIHPHKYYREAGRKGQNAQPVGSGPYRITRYEPGKRIVMERNANYYAGTPKSTARIGKIEIRFIPDLQTQIASLMTGDADLLMMPLPRDMADNIERDPRLHVVSVPTMRVNFLQFNVLDTTASPALQDVRIRQAIAHAIDSEAIAKASMGRGYELLPSFCWRGQFGCTGEGVPRYEYSPQKAKELLAQAGYASGVDVVLNAFFSREAAEMIQGYLKQAGIRASVQYEQYPAVREKQRNGTSGITYASWGSYSVNDVSAILPVYFGMEGDDTARRPEIAEAVLRAGRTMERAARQRDYATALRLIGEQALIYPMFSVGRNFPATRELDLGAQDSDRLRFWDMRWR